MLDTLNRIHYQIKYGSNRLTVQQSAQNRKMVVAGRHQEQNK
jgi:hypothetical protein